jgi:hypothetical protein
MKGLLKTFVTLLIIGALGGCAIILGPDEPAGSGGGNLTISFGGGDSRAISAGTDLPADVLAGLRYEINLTGPGDEVITETVSGGETLNLTVTPGQWRIDAAAYQGEGPAGTGSLGFTVVSGANTVRVPMMMSGPCYELAIDPGIANGTVKTNFTAAFAGTEITVTVVPDTDYVLKDGTFQYDAGGSAYSIGESGQGYTFIMPAADVRISAYFNKIIGDIVIEGLRDEGVTVTAVHSGGRQPATEISWSANESVTFTLTSSGYTEGSGNLMWFVEGARVTGTGNTLVINARNYVPRRYTVTVMVKVNGQWYSTDTQFVVKP